MKITIELDINHAEARLLQMGDVYNGNANNHLSELVRNLLLARAASNVNRSVDAARQSRRLPVAPPKPSKAKLGKHTVVGPYINGN